MNSGHKNKKVPRFPGGIMMRGVGVRGIRATLRHGSFSCRILNQYSQFGVHYLLRCWIQCRILFASHLRATMPSRWFICGRQDAFPIAAGKWPLGPLYVKDQIAFCAQQEVNPDLTFASPGRVKVWRRVIGRVEPNLNPVNRERVHFPQFRTSHLRRSKVTHDRTYMQ